MEQLVNQITNQTGISEDQAQQAIQTVVGFLRGKLPEPIANQVESALGITQGGVLGGQGLGGVTDQVGDTLGNLGNVPPM